MICVGLNPFYRTMDLAIVATSTVAALLVVGYTMILARLDEIKENWIAYRCNPLYMPFAGLVGVDVASNFTQCTMKNFQDYAGFILDPIQNLFKVLLDAFQTIGNTLNDIRKMFSGVRNGFLAAVTMVFGKLANTMSSVQYIILRMRTVFMRLMGIFAVLINVMNTGIASGKSVINGPVGKTVKFLSGGGI